MRFIPIFGLFSFLLLGCQGLQPKGIGLDIQFVKAPTAKEAAAWRKAQKWERKVVEVVGEREKAGWVNEKNQVLINGEAVDKTLFPAVVRITSASGAGCTAHIVGKRAIITAAHCVKTGEKAMFKTVDGKSYSATFLTFEKYPDTDLDLSLGIINANVAVKPGTIRTDRFETKGMLVDLMGFGCINPGGGGGNDGVLRAGKAKVAGGQAYDLVLDAAPSALCYGDSGGPVFYEGKQIGVNSKGNIEDKSYTTRTTLPDAKAWLESAAQKLGVEVCGINSQCDGSTPPPPGPKSHVFENDVMKVTVDLK